MPSRDELCRARADFQDLLAAVNARIALLTGELTSLTAVAAALSAATTATTPHAAASGGYTRYVDPFSPPRSQRRVQRSAPPLSTDAKEALLVQQTFPHHVNRQWSKDEDEALLVALAGTLETHGALPNGDDAVDDAAAEREGDRWQLVSDNVTAVTRRHYGSTARYWLEPLGVAPSKTPDACMLHYYNSKRCIGGSRDFKSFTRAEDKVMLSVVSTMPASNAVGRERVAQWEMACRSIHGRTPFQMAARFQTLARKRKHPGRSSAPFTEFEDGMLRYFGPLLGTATLLTARLNSIALENVSTTGGASILVRSFSEVERRCRTLGVDLSDDSAAIELDDDTPQTEPGATRVVATIDAAPTRDANQTVKERFLRVAVEALNGEATAIAALSKAFTFGGGAVVAVSPYEASLALHKIRTAPAALVVAPPAGVVS